MANLIDLEVATPERELVREMVEEVQIPAKDGYIGVLPGHAPLLAELGAGFLRYKAGERPRYLSVAGGFLEVLPDHVRVLADVAEPAEEIDVERARKALERAEESLINPSLGVDPAVALAAMERAQARLAAAEQK
ncbi:MAG TPA: F0F1 ATP synthase subunit epsilon [Bryobacteraceae bacterium]|nr:F0F1 ATP synthase subunit epsilon [Bryobacteraceae bacterium]